jgi:Family of unknown function (DUF6308)
VTDDPVVLRDRLRLYLDDGAEALLRDYFTSFDGRRFERLGGHGDDPVVANQFTAEDLVAVSLLGVTIDPKAALSILEDDRVELDELLEEIPVGVDLWDVAESVVAVGSPADRLWHRLVEIPGIGQTIAGKLLARKRPHLIPIYDTVVEEAVGITDRWWVTLRSALQDEALRERLAVLRARSEVGDDISLLRILDVAIWMEARGSDGDDAEPEP